MIIGLLESSSSDIQFGLPPVGLKTLAHLRFVCLLAALLVRAGTGFAQFQTPPAQVPVTPATGHVFLIVLENTSYGTMTNSANSTTYMPNLVALGNKYGHTTNYITNSGGSLLAYLWLSSGYCHSDPNSTADCPHPPFPAGVTGLHSFGCTGGACINPATQNFWPITDDNIYREMINHTPNPIPRSSTLNQSPSRAIRGRARVLPIRLPDMIPTTTGRYGTPT